MTTISRALLAGVAATALGGVLFVWACESPTAPSVEEAAPSVEVEAAASSTPATHLEPAFTPMTVRPVLTNATVVSEALRAEYPAVLRDAGIGGAPMLWIHIAVSGEVDDARVFGSSGFEALDQAAMNVARTMRFQPAMNGDAVTDAWVQIPIRFQVVR